MREMDLEKLWQEMLTLEGPELDLVIERTADAQLRDGLDRHFSEEAMEGLIMNIQTFILTRLVKYQDATGLAPQNMKVSISLDLSA